MAENLNQPRDYDAVKGGNNSPPLTGVVLGGLPGVKHRLASSVVEVRFAALKDALNYGQAGLDLLIETFNNQSGQLQREVYLILKQRQDPEAREAIREFNPYLFFECVRTLTVHTTQISSIAISPDGQTQASASYGKTIKLWQLTKEGTIKVWQ